MASQEAIKELGTNGGGFFNANSAHPFENPTPFTNLLQMLLIFVIPAGLTYTFGKMVGNTKQGWAILAAMTILFTVGVAVTTVAEQDGNPLLTTAGANQSTEIAGADAPGGNMEGKETRFGISDEPLFAVITTAASCGAVNAMHDSFTPLGGLVPLANIGLGEVIFGGVGAGLYGILVYAVIAIFIAGLMVGRTPEYLGKKIEAYDVKMAMLALLVIPLVILSFTGVSLVIGDGLGAIWNPGPHGLSEVLYAFTSGGRQQRLGVRRSGREHALVQRHARHRDAGRPLPDDRADPGAGRLAGPQEAARGDQRHLPDHRSALDRLAGGRDRDRRRADLLPGLLARSDHRALRHEPWLDLRQLIANCGDRN